jgi:fused signal recognition particle receptor
MGVFDKIREGLAKTRDQFVTRIEWIVRGKTLDEDSFNEIEEAIILSDAGFETSEFLLASLKESWRRGRIRDAEDIERFMGEEIEKLLLPAEAPLVVQDHAPFVIVALGVNGVGKTTTIAKLANIYKGTGKSIMLAACDTFRAAAVEQLEVWARRLDVDLIKQNEGSDPAAVAFDAARAAKARNIDVLILDTAGRLHTKVNLMEEMKKIKRVLSREIGGAPHETLLIVDATTGQNAIAQAKTFGEAIGITGIVITKLDGTAKGGFLLPIARSLQIPIRFIGVGEKIDDLVPFSARGFARALFH